MPFMLRSRQCLGHNIRRHFVGRYVFDGKDLPLDLLPYPVPFDVEVFRPLMVLRIFRNVYRALVIGEQRRRL